MKIFSKKLFSRSVVAIAICFAGLLIFFGCKKAAVPGCVENFTATAGYEQVELAWKAPLDDGGSIITGYELTLDDWTDKVTKTASQLSHTYSGLINDTEYSFKIRALNTQGAGAESVLTATPKAMDVKCGVRKKNDEEYVTMCAVPCAVRLDNIAFTLSFENHTNNGVSWGYIFWVEYCDGLKWNRVDLDLGFPLPSITLNPGEKEEWKISFTAEQLNYTTGKYRIGKHFGIPGVSSGLFGTVLYAEFEVY